jgi:Fe2+ transport system protein FeoA
LVRSAPLGDPLQVEMRGYQLSLRVAEACGILVRAA